MKVNLSPIEVSAPSIKDYIAGMALGAVISILLCGIVLAWLSLP